MTTPSTESNNNRQKLTVDILIKAGMPLWNINKFKREWPDGCEITPENFRRAEKIGLWPDALYAATAVDPDGDWHCNRISTAYDWKRDELKKKHDAEFAALRAAEESEKLAYKCKLLYAAIFGDE